MNSESNESNEINRIYKCTKNDNTITLNMNENPVYKDYFEQLNRVHTNIDMKHDQYDFSRVNARMRNDEKYKNNIQKAIDSISCPTGRFTITKGTDEFEYKTNKGVHSLEHALERNTLDDTIKINNAESPNLNPLLVIPYEFIKNKNPIENAGIHQFEIKRFTPNKDKGKRQQESSEIAEYYYGTTERPASFVMDCGSKSVFNGLCSDQSGGKNNSVAIFSGIMDSSSSSEIYTPTQKPKNSFVVNLPFMYLSEGENNIININLQVSNNKNNYKEIEVTFQYNTEPQTTPITITEIPNLPEISDYLANEAYNKEVRKKCIDLLLKHFNRNDTIEKCKPLLDSAKYLYGQIYSSGTSQDTSQDTFEYHQFIRQFFMNIKHWGDKFRAIDAVILSEDAYQQTFTGTLDTFLMRFICLSNLYGCYANINNNIILNDVKQLTEKQIAQKNIKTAKTNLNKLQTKLKHIATFGELFDNGPYNDKINEYVRFFQNMFSNPISIYAPRGQLVRRLVSCVVPPQFSVMIGDKQIIFDENDMYLVWNVHILFIYLQKLHVIKSSQQNDYTEFIGKASEASTTAEDNMAIVESDTEIVNKINSRIKSKINKFNGNSMDTEISAETINDTINKLDEFEKKMLCFNDLKIINSLFENKNTFVDLGTPNNSIPITTIANKTFAVIKYSRVYSYEKYFDIDPNLPKEWSLNTVYPLQAQNAGSIEMMQTGGFAHFFKLQRNQNSVASPMKEYIEKFDNIPDDPSSTIETTTRSDANYIIKFKGRDLKEKTITTKQIDHIFGGESLVDVLTYSYLDSEKKIETIKGILRDKFPSIDQLDCEQLIQIDEKCYVTLFGTGNDRDSIRTNLRTILSNNVPVISVENYTGSSDDILDMTFNFLLYSVLYQKLFSYYNPLRLLIYNSENIGINNTAEFISAMGRINNLLRIATIYPSPSADLGQKRGLNGGGSDGSVKVNEILSQLYSNYNSAKIEYLDHLCSDDEVEKYEEYIKARINLYDFYAIIESIDNNKNGNGKKENQAIKENQALEEMNMLLGTKEMSKIIIESLKGKLESITSQFKATIPNVDNVNENFETLKKQIITLKKTSQSAKQSANEKEKITINKKLSAINNKEITINKKLSAIKKKKQTIKGKLSAIKEEIQNLQSVITERNQETDGNEKEIQNLQIVITEGNQEIDGNVTVTNISELTKRISELTKQVNRLTTDAEELLTKTEYARNSVSNIMSQQDGFTFNSLSNTGVSSLRRSTRTSKPTDFYIPAGSVGRGTRKIKSKRKNKSKKKQN